jgi:hypothetical protein
MPRSATTHPVDSEALLESLRHRQQRLHIGGVAGPDFTADRSSFTVEHHANDHLLQVWPVILGESMPADVLSPRSLEVDAGGIEEHQIEFGEQVAAMLEHLLLNQVFHTTLGQRPRVSILVR